MDPIDFILYLSVMLMVYATIYIAIKSYEYRQDCKRIEKQNAETESKIQAYHNRTISLLNAAKNMPSTQELDEILKVNDIISSDLR